MSESSNWNNEKLQLLMSECVDTASEIFGREMYESSGSVDWVGEPLRSEMIPGILNFSWKYEDGLALSVSIQFLPTEAEFTIRSTNGIEGIEKVELADGTFHTVRSLLINALR